MVDVGEGVHVASTVQRVADLILPGTVGGDGDRAREGLGASGVGAALRRAHGSSHQQRELGGIAAVQRHVLHAARVDHLRERGGLGVNLWSGGFDGDGLLDRAQHQRNVDGHPLIRAHHDGLLGVPAEAGGADVQRISARPQGRRHVHALGVGCRGA